MNYRNLLLILVLSATSAHAAMVHPGGWHTQADLDRIRGKVKAGQEPWKSAWTALEKSEAGLNTKAHVQPESNNNYAIQGDGHSAYVLAIKWVASGDKRYAEAAIKLINAWTSTVKTIGSEPMRSGLGGSQMAQAAEILAHGFKGEAGWNSAEIKRAQGWFKTVVYPHPNKGASANWGTSAMGGIMSMAVFCDDPEMFLQAMEIYKNGFVINGSGKNGCCGVTQYIDATGENAESGRDQPHSQGGIAHLVEVALCAANQGVDLVTYNDATGVRDYGVTGDNRLLLGFEYTAKYNLGEEVPYHPFFEYCNNVTKYPTGPAPQGRANYSPVWEMAYSLFTRAKLKAPYCKRIIELPTYSPEKSNSDHPGMGTLTFRN
ncbi:MAG: alginate lyase family protein [Luteolibacter sp.]